MKKKKEKRKQRKSPHKKPRAGNRNRGIETEREMKSGKPFGKTSTKTESEIKSDTMCQWPVVHNQRISIILGCGRRYWTHHKIRGPNYSCCSNKVLHKVLRLVNLARKNWRSRFFGYHAPGSILAYSA